MSISEIQKKKFLDNVYKLLYSSGYSSEKSLIKQPDESEVKKLFDEYFVVNRIGVPLSIDVSEIRNTPVTDPDLMNQSMARALLNLEVLYDSLDFNTKRLLSSVSVLNKRFDQLKGKRVELESKVDDILFSVSNTDGYFYSFSDSFATIDHVDLSLSTAFVDTENRKTTLPILKSSVLDFNAPGKIALSGLTYSTYFNGSTVVEGAIMQDVSNLFDGLDNTSAIIEHSSNQIGACAVVITIPVATPFIISRIDGRLTTSSAVTTVVEIIDNANNQNSQFRRQQSNSGYDRFSFDFSPQNSGVIKLTLIKSEPDYVDQLSADKKYKYIFRIRDLIISGQHYDSRASLVSSPLSIPAGDINKIIDAVSVEVSSGNEESGQILYFVASDVPGAVSLSDFNWIPISSSTSNSPSFDQIISFKNSTKLFRKIKQDADNEDILLYPISSDSNLSNKNPSNSIYNGVNVYRVGSLKEQDTPYNSYILDSVNTFNFRYIPYAEGAYLDKARWSSLLNENDPSVNVFSPGPIRLSNAPSIPIALNLSGISGYLGASILCENETIVSNTFSKSGNAVNWNVAIYLNGNLLADVQSGLSSKEITWNFIQGINTIDILFDAQGSSLGNITLMDGVSLSSYGTVFLNYYSYVDPFDFRVNRSILDKVFTVDNYLGNKEILCRNQINDNSRFIYYNNSTLNPVKAIRFRADLSRFTNPFGTPVLSKYRVKFKNSI